MQNGTMSEKERGLHEKRSLNLRWVRTNVSEDNPSNPTTHKNEHGPYSEELHISHPYPPGPVHQIFEEVVKQNPQATALIFEDTTLTYQQLNEKVNQWAWLLQQRDVQPGDFVGLCMPKSIDFVVAVLAIFKAGGAYVPLDPLYPKERLLFIARDTRLKIIISEDGLEEIFAEENLSFFYPHKEHHIADQQEKRNLPITVTADSPAYVMFTSGSTGNPKGVCCVHRGIIRLVKNTNYIPLYPEQVYMLHTHVAFDGSTFELWAPLLNGASLVIPSERIPSLDGLATSIHKYHVTTVWFTTGLFNMMVDKKIAAFAGLREVITGGDVASITHVKKFLAHYPDCMLINGYGPTENTTFSTCYTLNDLSPLATTVPIGKAISHTTVYILDENMQPVQDHNEGEIYVGGDGLAQCYVNREDLTAQKFLCVTFSPTHTERLYRTGDIGRYLEDGNIEFLGRKDNQVKIRGFRVETGEIRAALSQHPGVEDCVIVVRQDKREQKYLAAFVTLKKTHDKLQKRDLYYFLKSSLPDFMIPSIFVIMDSLPLNQSGKVDAKKLAAMQLEEEHTEDHSSGEQTATEKTLMAIWKDLLADGNIGINDDFFELGGQSLIAIQMFGEVDEQLGVKLPVSVIFQHPTIHELGKVIDDRSQRAWRSLQPIRSGNGRPAFYAIPGGFLYQHVINHLGEDQPVYCFEPPDQGSIKEAANLYLEELLAHQPEGPYCLSGYCEHGLVAYEMAQMLRAQGKEVSLLVLFETYTPSSFIPRSSLRFYTKKLSMLFRELLAGSLKEKLKFVATNVKNGAAIFKKDEMQPYDPQPYKGRLLLFKADRTDVAVVDRPYMGWEDHVSGKIEIHSIPGTHMGMLSEERLAKMIAVALRSTMEDAFRKMGTAVKNH